MAITTDFTSHIKGAITADATSFKLDTGTADLCDQLAAPSHVFLQLYTAQASEIVVATSCDGVDVVVTRAMDGTQARSWPDETCVCVIRIVDGPVPQEMCDCESCPSPWDQLTATDGLYLNKADPDSPIVGMSTTGVTPGQYGGAEVNDRGQFTNIPPGWPASALPTFDPCACDGGGGGGAPGQVDAADVIYTPQGAPGIITANNVQVAFEQLEDAVGVLQGQGIGVNSLTATNGVQNTGTGANPVIELTNTGVTPGTYDGFTVDSQGRVTGYAAPTNAHTVVAGTDPVTVTFNSPTKTYTVDVKPATTTAEGVVQKISPGDVLAGSVPAAEEENVLTYEGGKNLLIEQAKTVTAGDALTGGGQLTGDITLDVDFTKQPLATTYTTPQFLIYDGAQAPDHQRVDQELASQIVRGAHALLRYDGAADAVQAEANVASVNKNGTGDYTVDMADAGNTNYVALAQPGGDTPDVVVTTEVLSSTQFRIRAYQGGALTDAKVQVQVTQIA